MPFDPSRHHRRSVRVRRHDYAGGLYFVTACTHGRQRLFGEVASGAMVLSEAGHIARDEWLRTPEVRESVVLDAFVVMPDHVHLLFGIIEPGSEGVLQHAPTDETRPLGSSSGTVAAALRGYKGSVTREAWARLGREVGRVWQRGFHDRIVRTDGEADALRRYISNNPMRWDDGRDRADGHRA